MDFKELLLEADKNQKIAAKQAQQVKRISTHFTAPVKKEEKSSQPKSEALQKLLHEKEKERQRKKDVEEKLRRKKEKEKAEREKEEKAKSVFRIPKKAAQEAPLSDAESFSSISSDDEPAMQKSLSKQSHGEASQKSSSHRHSSGHRDKASSSDKSSSKYRREDASKVESSSKPNGLASGKDGRSSSEIHKHSSSSSHSKPSSSQSHKQSSVDKHSTSDKPKHSLSHGHKQSSSSSSKRSSSSKDSHKQPASDSDKHSTSEKHKHSSEKHSSSSSSSKYKSSDKRESSSKTTSEKVHSHRQDESEVKVENDSSGYITSPDITSEEEDEEEEDEKRTSNTKHASEENDSKKDNSLNVPVTLTRHHLKPTIERTGCSLEERNKVLAKLQAIREKMSAGECDDSPRKRAAKGEVKRRRARREKLDGDFTGSCMEKIDYSLEEKPSLKRPEPKPEEPKPVKEKKKLEKLKISPKEKSHKEFSSENDRHRTKAGSSSSHRSNSDSKHSLSSKHNRFDAMREKPKKPRPLRRPPPVNFADLMKMAEQKQAEPVMVEAAPKKKEKERRPMTQDEINRERTREERVKSKEYKDWYKFGEKALKTEHGNSSGASRDGKEKESGGFLRQEANVIPPSSDSGPSKSVSSSQGNQQLPGARHNQRPGSSNSHPPPQAPSNRPSSGFKPQPHPTRPGMIANKPLAMAQHISNGQKLSQGSAHQSKKRPASPESRPVRDTSPKPKPRAYEVKGGNAWDSLFNRPEYKKLKEPPAKKGRVVIESEEEEDYEDDMDDFIDDEGEEDLDSVSGAIRKLFGYDKRRFRDEDEDDRNMEVGFSQVMKEEARSARLGRQEDLEDIRKEQEELRQKALRKKMKR